MSKRVKNNNINKRHFVKALSWRFIGTMDTLFLTFIFSGSIEFGIKVSLIEISTKLFLFYIHEKLWFKSKVNSVNKRHVLKTFSWRFIATSDTIIISTIIIGNPYTGFKIGVTELITKMLLYYTHEKFWYKSNFGLEKMIK